MKAKIKPSVLCKNAGLKSLCELSDITGQSVQTLNNWHKYKPKLFDLLLVGAVTEKFERKLSG